MSDLVSLKFRKISDHDLAQYIENDTEAHERGLIELLGLGADIPAYTGDRTLASVIYGEPLTDREVAVWSKFLPNCYSYNAGDWGDYDYLMPPADLLTEIKLALELGVFTDLHIWTPEDDPDPVVVGVIETAEGEDTAYWLIAQWGESIRPYYDIAAEYEPIVDADEEQDIAYAHEIRSYGWLKRYYGNGQASNAANLLIWACCTVIFWFVAMAMVYTLKSASGTYPSSSDAGITWLASVVASSIYVHFKLVVPTWKRLLIDNPLPDSEKVIS